MEAQEILIIVAIVMLIVGVVLYFTCMHKKSPKKTMMPRRGSSMRSMPMRSSSNSYKPRPNWAQVEKETRMGMGSGAYMGCAQSDCPNMPQFDSWNVALSFAPNFCAKHNSPNECAQKPDGTYVHDYILHGAWPQFCNPQDCGDGNKTCNWPESCQDQYNPSQSDLMNTLNQIAQETGCNMNPDPMNPCGGQPAGCLSWQCLAPAYADGLVVHEWQKHGTCSGMNPHDYLKTALTQAYKYYPQLPQCGNSPDPSCKDQQVCLDASMNPSTNCSTCQSTIPPSY